VLLSHYCYVVTTSMLRALCIAIRIGAMVPRSKMSAKTCVNHLFGYSNGHGKSPCFSGVVLSCFVSLDWLGPCLQVLDVGVLL
jgi:hypothetical protein